MKAGVLFCFDTSIGADQVLVALYNATTLALRTTVLFSSGDTQPLLQKSIELLQAHSLIPRNIRGVAVVAGASRFTIARLCVVIANAWSWSLHIPVFSYATHPSLATMWYDISIQQQQLQHPADSYPLIQPQYTKEPTITL